MKRFYYTVIALFLSLPAFYATSCAGFFEIPDDTTMNEDSVFMKIVNVRQMVYHLYTGAPNTVCTRYEERMYSQCPDVLSDCAAGWLGQPKQPGHKFHNAQLTTAIGSVTGAESVNSENRGEFIFRWPLIRTAYTLINRVDETPDATYEEKERIKAESKVFIAWMYFEMFKRFGGVPLVKGRLDDPNEFRIPRSSLQDTYNYIIQLLDEAIANPHLPARAIPTEFGRITKAFAYGLKARTKLWAASPLFNTGTPFMDMGANNNLICFGNEDPERWKEAADAATDAIDYCLENGYKIVADQASPFENYKMATTGMPSNGNTEIIQGRRQQMIRAGILNLMPRGRSGWDGTVPTHNLVEMYRRTDGSFIDWSSPIVAKYPSEPYKDLEARFHFTIGYNGAPWTNTTTPDSLQYWEVPGQPSNSTVHGKDSPIFKGTNYCYTTHKYTWGHENQTTDNPAWWITHLNMRMAELYFIRAEALNEYNHGPEGSTCVADLNTVLNRAGMSVPENMGYDEMKAFIERERAIEFFLEDHRYMDLKRTLRAMDVLNFTTYNVKCERTGSSSAYVYTYTKYSVQNRKFLQHYYLWCFPDVEINKDYGLIQNPGWD